MAEKWDECVIIDLPNLEGIQIVWSPAYAAQLLSETGRIRPAEAIPRR